MKKLILGLLSVILIALIFGGCEKHETLTVEEATEWFNNIEPKALKAFSMCWSSPVGQFQEDDGTWITDGIQTYMPLEKAQYYERDMPGIQTLADLKAYVESVYTVEYAEKELYISLNPTVNEVSTPHYKEFNGKLYVNVNIGGMGFTPTTWLTDTMVITPQKDGYYHLEMDTLDLSIPDGKKILRVKRVDGDLRLDCSIIGGFVG